MGKCKRASVVVGSAYRFDPAFWSNTERDARLFARLATLPNGRPSSNAFPHLVGLIRDTLHAALLIKMDTSQIPFGVRVVSLREAGYSVTEAANADQALAFLSTKLPNLIIIDVKMPGSCDGLEFMAKVHEAKLKIPFIVTSAHLVPITNQFGESTHFLSKPYEFDAVIELIETELKK